jgi:hypothetical protein
MDPQERLRLARVAADEGRYADALREHIWIHEHALEYEPAFYGVRLSFALAYWVELANVYPEARRALEEIRDREMERLRLGKGDPATFHDVKSINEHLECERSTSDLFNEMASNFPALASRCADLALAALVKTERYELARRYVSVPDEKLRQFSDTLNRDVEALAKQTPSSAPTLDAYVQIYAERVALLSAILRGVGEIDEASSIESSALQLVQYPEVREAVREALSR